MDSQWKQISGTIQSGYRVASGLTDSSPYPKGTIEMQTPIFQSLGLDLSPYFPGTLNVLIAPYQFAMKAPKYTFREVHWIEGYAPEDFSFSSCHVTYQNQQYDSLVYYPHPETKIDHFQDPSIIEIISPRILGLNYGDRLTVEIDLNQIDLIEPKP
jgi:CTP-dependent riboflavin kinase